MIQWTYKDKMPKDVAHPCISEALFVQDSNLLELEPRVRYSLHKVSYYGINCCGPVDAYPGSVTGVEDQVADIWIPIQRSVNNNVTPKITYRC
jgi:hypothetical protein